MTDSADKEMMVYLAAIGLISELKDKVAEIRDSQTGASNVQYVKEIVDIFHKAGQKVE